VKSSYYTREHPVRPTKVSIRPAMESRSENRVADVLGASADIVGERSTVRMVSIPASCQLIVSLPPFWINREKSVFLSTVARVIVLQIMYYNLSLIV
jgi:hypothetical protein